MHAPVPGGEAQPADRKKRDRKLRADVFEVPANTGEAQAIVDFWAVWRQRTSR